MEVVMVVADLEVSCGGYSCGGYSCSGGSGGGCGGCSGCATLKEKYTDWSLDKP